MGWAWRGFSAAARAKRRSVSTSALKQQPDYRPALLNLAIVAQQYLKDRQLALREVSGVSRVKAAASQRGSPGGDRAPARTGTQPARRDRAATNEPAQPSTRANPPRPAATNVARAATAAKAEPAPATPKAAPANVVRAESAAHVPRPAPTNVTAPPDECRGCEAGSGAGPEAGAGCCYGSCPIHCRASRIPGRHRTGAGKRGGTEGRQARLLPAP